MQPSSIFRSGERALDAVSESFSPRRGASSAEIRKNGLLCLGIGLLGFLISGSLIFVAPGTPALAMLPALLSYAFMIVGAYRAVLGKTPEPSHPGELSLKRIAFAVVTIVFLFSSLGGLMYVGNFLYELLQPAA